MKVTHGSFLDEFIKIIDRVVCKRGYVSRKQGVETHPPQTGTLYSV